MYVACITFLLDSDALMSSREPFPAPLKSSLEYCMQFSPVFLCLAFFHLGFM